MKSENEKIKEGLKQIFFDALKLHNPEKIVLDFLKENRKSFEDHKSIEIVAVGKSAFGMAVGAAKFFEEKVKRGLIITNTSHNDIPERFSFLLSSHPLPDEKSLIAGRSLIKFCESTSPDSLLLFLVSGGTSAMVAVPSRGISLEMKKEVTSLLQRKGVAIEEMNHVRKLMSEIKGGKLLRFIKSKRIINLLISDVPGNDISTIGSGLLVPREPDGKKVSNILDGLTETEISEKLKDLMDSFPNSSQESEISSGQELMHKIIDSNDKFLTTIKNLAQIRGFKPVVRAQPVTSDVYIASRDLLIEFESYLKKPAFNGGKPFLFISGGETTSKVKGEGRGGRNCEMAMRLAQLIKNTRFIQLSVGTDGSDGNSGLAGGIIDGTTYEQSLENGLIFDETLNSSDSAGWLRSVGSAIQTGHTGINLADLYLLCKY
jgi:glycerate-2-kinase